MGNALEVYYWRGALEFQLLETGFEFVFRNGTSTTAASLQLSSESGHTLLLLNALVQSELEGDT